MTGPIAVLSSGGLDSCALLAEMARHTKVYPIYIRAGLIWEKEEVSALQAFTKALNNRNVQSITILAMPIQTLYGDHWSLSGHGTPTRDDPDKAVYLPGHNVLLLSLAAVWCSIHRVPKIAIGTLCKNPFPDAKLDFLSQFCTSLSNGLDFKISIEAPYRKDCRKEDLIRQYSNLPLELSFTCINPQEGLHCGRCNKCKERQVAYEVAGVKDQTRYTQTA